IRALAMVANGTHVLTAADDKTVKLWNVGNGASERTFGGAEGAVNSVAVSKNTVLVAAGGADKQVRIYNFADAKLLTTLKTPAAVRGLAFNGTNQILAAVCEDKSILTWNVVSTAGQPNPPDFGKPIQEFAHAAAGTDIAFAPDNVTIYTSSLDKTAKAWKV